MTDTKLWNELIAQVASQGGRDVYPAKKRGYWAVGYTDDDGAKVELYASKRRYPSPLAAMAHICNRETGYKRISHQGICAVRVVFRKCEYGVTAIFDDREEYPYLTGYAHIGQHHKVSMDWVRKDTRLATEEEYTDLKKELISRGYILDVRKAFKSYYNPIT